MQIGHAFAAILREAEATVGIFPMEEIDPQVVQEQTRHIPAQVQIPADQVRDMGNLIERSAHRITGKGA